MNYLIINGNVYILDDTLYRTGITMETQETETEDKAAYEMKTATTKNNKTTENKKLLRTGLERPIVRIRKTNSQD